MAQNETTQIKSGNPIKEFIPVIVIFGSIILGYLIWGYVMGSRDNFVDDEMHTPVSEGIGKWLGLFYLGGILVGTAIGLFLITVTFTIERLLTLSKATGRGQFDVFIQKIQIKLENDDVDGAIEECDRQKGTVGNVVKEALKKYKAALSQTGDLDRRAVNIQKAIEEATALELPMLEKHLTIIATIVSTATLVGLIGTVLGMIRAFSALGGSGGSPDVAALSIGISEALVNTASGITTSTVATISYNYFTSRVDDITYRIDEAGISIIETFKSKAS